MVEVITGKINQVIKSVGFINFSQWLKILEKFIQKRRETSAKLNALYTKCYTLNNELDYLYTKINESQLRLYTALENLSYGWNGLWVLKNTPFAQVYKNDRRRLSFRDNYWSAHSPGIRLARDTVLEKFSSIPQLKQLKNNFGGYNNEP